MNSTVEKLIEGVDNGLKIGGYGRQRKKMRKR